MDFATILSPALTFDWAIVDGEVQTDDGLFTAVAISLFSDRLANADDVLPDESGDRRGWGGDVYLDRLSTGRADHIGSRLWLLARSLQIRETALNAQAYCEEALQWLADDGVAQEVTVPIPTFPRLGMMGITVIITRQDAHGTKVNHRYDFLWDMTRSSVSVSGIAIGGI